MDDLKKLLQNLNKSHKKETPVVKVDSSIPEEFKCSICLEQMAVPTALIPCMHTYCKVCIDQWMKKS